MNAFKKIFILVFFSQLYLSIISTVNKDFEQLR